jgi:hypothetical protein
MCTKVNFGNDLKNKIIDRQNLIDLDMGKSGVNKRYTKADHDQII